MWNQFPLSLFGVENNNMEALYIYVSYNLDLHEYLILLHPLCERKPSSQQSLL